MFCHKCRVEVPENNQFCQTCGSPVSSKPMLCNKCGAEIPENTKFCRKCGSPVSLKAVRRQRPLWGRIEVISSLVVAGGAILMIIALAIPWYTARVSGSGVEVSGSSNMFVDELLDHIGPGWSAWTGLGLPIVLIVFFASLCLLSVGYALIRRSQPRRLWYWLASLSILSLLANFGYTTWYVMDYTSEISDGFGQGYITPHAGSILALFGAIVIILGSEMHSKKYMTSQ